MNSILKILLSLSVSGSLLILILLAAKPLLRGRCSRQLQHIIWLVVIARLLLPFAPRENLVNTAFDLAYQTMRPVLAQFFPQAGVSAPFAFPVTGAGQQDNFGQIPRESDKDTPFPSSNATVDFSEYHDTEKDSLPFSSMFLLFLSHLWLAWLLPAFCLAVYKIAAYRHFARYLKTSGREVSDPTLLDHLSLLQARLGIRRPVELYTNHTVSSPLLLGWRRPCIILPTTDLPEEEMHYTLLHELTHHRQRHLPYKWLVQFTLCLHWFNPLVWRMSREINHAGELACDEAVIRTLDPQEQRVYGDTLLHAFREGTYSQDSLGSLALGESAALLKERLGAIKQFRKPSRKSVAFSMILTLALLAGATATGACVETADTEFPLLRPLVSGVSYMEDASPEELAGKYVTDGRTDGMAAGKTYTYEGEGFGGDFVIQINEDGFFSYYEGLLSSYLGAGTWTLEDDILVLSDNAEMGHPFVNYFRLDGKDLVFLAENSSNFIYVKVKDGERFLCGSEE